MAQIPHIPGVPQPGGYLTQVAANRARRNERASQPGVWEKALAQGLAGGLSGGLGALGGEWAKSLFADDDLEFASDLSEKANADIEIFTEPDPETISQEGLQRRLDGLLASDEVASGVGVGRGQELGEQKKGRFAIDKIEGVPDWTKKRDAPAPDEVEGPGRMTTMNRAILAMQQKAGTEQGRKELHRQLYPAVPDPKAPDRAPRGRRFKSAKYQAL